MPVSTLVLVLNDRVEIDLGRLEVRARGAQVATARLTGLESELLVYLFQNARLSGFTLTDGHTRTNGDETTAQSGPAEPLDEADQVTTEIDLRDELPPELR